MDSVESLQLAGVAIPQGLEME